MSRYNLTRAWRVLCRFPETLIQGRHNEVAETCDTTVAATQPFFKLMAFSCLSKQAICSWLGVPSPKCEGREVQAII